MSNTMDKDKLQTINGSLVYDALLLHLLTEILEANLFSARHLNVVYT